MTNRMASTPETVAAPASESVKQYDITLKNIMMWADEEIKSIGSITALENADLRYSYALSTLNGMAHLKDALDQLIKNKNTVGASKRDLTIKLNQVIRVMKHLMKQYNLDIKAIKTFNVKKVLGSLEYLGDSAAAAPANAAAAPANAAAAPANGAPEPGPTTKEEEETISKRLQSVKNAKANPAAAQEKIKAAQAKQTAEFKAKLDKKAAATAAPPATGAANPNAIAATTAARQESGMPTMGGKSRKFKSRKSHKGKSRKSKGRKAKTTRKNRK
jgi:hypothetical protein